MCLRDYEIDMELKSKKVPTYTPITEGPMKDLIKLLEDR